MKNSNKSSMEWLDPDFPFLLEGMAFFRKCQWDDAIREFEKGLKYVEEHRIDDEAPYVRSALNFHIGLTYKMQGELDKAQQIFEKSISHKDDSVTRLSLGKVYYEKGMVSKAQEQFKLAIKSDAKDAYTTYWSLIGLAKADLSNGKVANGIKKLLASLNLFDNKTRYDSKVDFLDELDTDVAEQLLNLGYYDDVIFYVKKILDRKPENKVARKILAESYGEKSMYKESVEEWRKYLTEYNVPKEEERIVLKKMLSHLKKLGFGNEED